MVISISNIKGGVAKTTTAATLAAGLHKRGKKVLLIDSDPQMNLTLCFTSEPNDDAPSLYNIYKYREKISDVKMEIKPGLDLVAGDFALSTADLDYLTVMKQYSLLNKSLKECKDDYDYIIIDTPPNMGFLSVNAFVSSDYIITPMATDLFSLKAIRLLKHTIDMVAEEEEKELHVIGVLLTRYAERTTVAKILEDNVNAAADLLDTSLFESRIRQAVVIQECQLAKMDIFEYAPKAPVAKDYDEFIDEFLERVSEKE